MKKKRLNLDLSEKTMCTLETVQVLTDSPSKTDVVRKGINLLHSLIVLEGELIYRAPDGKEKSLLILL